MNWPLIILIITIIIIIILLVIFTIQTANQIQRDAANNPVIGDTDQCVRSTSDLINISGNLCCCSASGFQTDLRYIPQLDVTVRPVATYYLDACAGFCIDGLFDPIAETCNSGSSVSFQRCVNYTKPIGCKGPAMPVAVIGTQFYYVHSATQAECARSGACAPSPNTCPSPSAET